ncbi:ATP-binding cassette domain-containing protein [Microbacterium sp. NPDC055683]
MSAPVPAPGLVLRNLSVAYDGAFAVRDVVLDVPRGQRVALIGESGSGKTTVCMAAAGFLPRSATIIADERSFEGIPIGAARQKTLIAPRVPGVVTIFQDAMSSLDPVATVGRQFRAVLTGVRRFSREGARQRAAGLLRSVGLLDVDRVWGSTPQKLSGGMRQRVMIALALAAEPRLIIADEPTSALDASVARETMEVLSRLTVETGAALLIVSHDIALCRHYVDHLVVMRGGAVVDRLTPAELAAREPGSSYARGLLDAIPTLENWDTARLATIEQEAVRA